MKKLFIIFLVLILCIHLPEKNFGRSPFLTSTAQSDSGWIQHASMPDTRYAAVSFTINDKAYVGLGRLSNGNYANDFYEYDPQQDLWTKKADFPDDGRYLPTAFSINGKGYVCLGFDNSLVCRNDLWEYNPDSNSWIQKADFPGMGRYGACAFVIGDRAYVGTGSYNAGNDYLYDIWCYNPVADLWTSKPDFPGGPRNQAVAFAIGAKGYIGSGSRDSYTPTKDFWCYDPIYGWKQIADLPGPGLVSCSSFVMNGKGYVGLGTNLVGNFKDFWSYKPALNTWNAVDPPPSYFQARTGAVSFSISNIGYIATGYTNTELLADLWSICEPPHCDFSFHLNDLSVSFTDQSDNADSWYWDFGDGTTSTLQNPVHSFDAVGTYNVCLTASNSCSNEKYCDSITVKLNGIEEINKNDIIIYPNPVTDQLHVRWGMISPISGKMLIINFVGSVIYEREIAKDQGASPEELNLRDLNPGMFDLIIITDDHVIVKKFIVDHRSKQ